MGHRHIHGDASVKNLNTDRMMVQRGRGADRRLTRSQSMVKGKCFQIDNDHLKKGAKCITARSERMEGGWGGKNITREIALQVYAQLACLDKGGLLLLEEI